MPGSNDYDLELYGSENIGFLKGSYQDTGISESISYNATTAGTYYVRVYGYPVSNGSFSTTAPYTLTVNMPLRRGIDAVIPAAVTAGAKPMLILKGAGFTNASTLQIGNGTTAYSNLSAMYIGQTELRYSCDLNLSPGTWTIRLMDGDSQSAIAQFAVVAASSSLQSLALSGPGSVSAGNTAQYVAMATFADGQVKAMPAVWSVAGLDGVTIGSTGLLNIPFGSSAGTITIAAGCLLNGVAKIASCTVAVTPAGSVAGAVGSYYITGPSLLAAGTNGTYALMQIQPDGSGKEVRFVSWGTSDRSYMQVDTSGLASAGISVASQMTVQIFANIGSVGNQIQVPRDITLVPSPGTSYFKVSVYPSTGGTVALQPLPTFSATGEQQYLKGQVVTAIAQPNAGMAFANWGESNLTANPYSLTVSGEIQLRPNFVTAASITGPKTLAVAKPPGLGKLSIVAPSFTRILSKSEGDFSSSALSTRDNVWLYLAVAPDEEFLGWMPAGGSDATAHLTMIDNLSYVARIRSRLSSASAAERTRQATLTLSPDRIWEGSYSTSQDGHYFISNDEYLHASYTPGRPGWAAGYSDAYFKIPPYVLSSMPKSVVSAHLRFKTANNEGAVQLFASDWDYFISSDSTTQWNQLPTAVDVGAQSQSYNGVGSTVDFDVTALFNAWQSGQLVDSGLILRATTLYGPQLWSCKASDVSNRPVLVLNWIEDAAPSGPPIFTSLAETTVGLVPGTAVRLGGTAVSDGLVTYEWLKNGVILPDATGPEFFVGETTGMGEGVYTLRATNPQGTTTEVFNVYPSAIAAPTIVSALEDLSVISGQKASISVAATGSGPLYYQWTHDGIPLYDNGRLAGATTATLTIANVSQADAGGYAVTILNSLGSVDGGLAHLSIQPTAVAPTVTKQPTSTRALRGGNAHFVAQFNGTPQPAVQWYHNGRAIPGAVGWDLVVNGIGPDDAGYYVAKATNTAGSAYSKGGFLVCDYGTTAISGSGWSYDGQLSIPPDLTDANAIESGAWHTLALRSDGTVVAWGKNELGQCNVPQSAANVVAVSAAGSYSLALREDGTIVAWGENGSGQCDVPAGLVDVVAISAGGAHVLAIRSNGTVISWGANDSGQATVPGGLHDVVQVAAGDGHSLALKSDGTMVCWGGNANGQIDIPVGIKAVKAIAAGSSHTLALQADGTLVAWGYSGFQNTQVPGGSDYVQIATAGNSLMALHSDGSVTSWGHNAYNEQINGGGNVVAMTCGAYFDLTMSAAPTVSAGAAEMAPQIISQPKNQQTTVGAPLTLFAQVSGSPIPQLQWRKNGHPIDGANAGMFTITAAAAADAGIYDLVAVNSAGLAVSSPCWVRVDLAQPFLSWSPPASITFGTPLGVGQLSAQCGTPGSLSYNYGLGTVLPVGSYVLLASFSPESPTSTSSGSIATSLTVLPAEQNISFAPIGDREFSTDPLTLSAAANSGLPVTFSVISGPATISGNSLTMTGAGFVVVRASQGGDDNYVAAADVDRSFTVSANYASWQQGKFTAGERGNASVSGPAADPDSDGISNLLEYAQSLDPKTPSRAGLPAIATVALSGQKYLTLNYTHQKTSTAPDLSYSFEASTDLAGWNPLTPVALATVDQGAAESVTVRDTVAIGATRSRFLRLSVSAQTTTATTPAVGAVTLPTLANSDTLVSVPLARPSIYQDKLSAVNGTVLTVTGTPGWTANQFVKNLPTQANTYYVQLKTGSAAGHFYTVTANAASTLTVDWNGETPSVAAGDQFELIPYWSLGTLYPPADAGVSFTNSINAAVRSTELIFPDLTYVGINPPTAATYYFASGAWHKVGAAAATSFSDLVLTPDSYFVQRNKAAASQLTTLGTVVTGPLATLLNAQGGTAKQDNPIALRFAGTVTLAQSNLVGSGVFQSSANAALRKDELLVYDNTTSGINKSISATYYYSGGAWRKVGASASADFGTDAVFAPGTGVILRKTGTGAGNPAQDSFWIFIVNP